MKEITINKEYIDWLKAIKDSVRKAQIKTALAANSSLIEFYWNLGREIFEKQQQAKWGSNFLDQLSKDLRQEFPQIKGFSTTNLKYCKLFYRYVLIRPQSGDELKPEISHQFGDKTNLFINKELYQKMCTIPWGHTKLIIGKIKNSEQAKFYIQQTIENGWSRDVLALQIKSDLYGRKGKSITNFYDTTSHYLPIFLYNNNCDCIFAVEY